MCRDAGTNHRHYRPLLDSKSFGRDHIGNNCSHPYQSIPFCTCSDRYSDYSRRKKNFQDSQHINRGLGIDRFQLHRSSQIQNGYQTPRTTCLDRTCSWLRPHCRTHCCSHKLAMTRQSQQTMKSLVDIAYIQLHRTNQRIWRHTILPDIHKFVNHLVHLNISVSPGLDTHRLHLSGIVPRPLRT